MTKQHLAAPNLFCLRLGAKRCFRDHLQQSHAGLGVLIELSIKGNKDLAAQAACSDLCPPGEERGTPLARSQSISLQLGNEKHVSKVVLAN